MADSQTQIIQKLMTELKLVTLDNQSLKTLQNSLLTNEEPDSLKESSTSIEIEEKLKLLFAKLLKDQDHLLESELINLKSQIEAKSSYLLFLENIKTKFSDLKNLKQTKESNLAAFKSATSKHKQLISKLILKQHLSLYRSSISSVIELKCEELSQKGIDVTKILKKIKKIFKINELRLRISRLESELIKLNKKKQKIEDSSDSSIEEFQDTLTFSSKLPLLNS